MRRRQVMMNCWGQNQDGKQTRYPAHFRTHPKRTTTGSSTTWKSLQIQSRRVPNKQATPPFPPMPTPDAHWCCGETLYAASRGVETSDEQGPCSGGLGTTAPLRNIDAPSPVHPMSSSPSPTSVRTHIINISNGGKRKGKTNVACRVTRLDASPTIDTIHDGPRHFGTCSPSLPFENGLMERLYKSSMISPSSCPS